MKRKLISSIIKRDERRRINVKSSSNRKILKLQFFRFENLICQLFLFKLFNFICLHFRSAVKIYSGVGLCNRRSKRCSWFWSGIVTRRVKCLAEGSRVTWLVREPLFRCRLLPKQPKKKKNGCSTSGEWPCPDLLGRIKRSKRKRLSSIIHKPCPRTVNHFKFSILVVPSYPAFTVS